MFVVVQTTTGQNFQFGFTGGTSVYLGDLDTPSLIDKKEDLNAAYGFFFRQSVDGHFNVKLGFLRGQLSAADSLSTLDWQLNRNLHFKTDYSEISLSLEYDLFDITTEHATKWWTPFASIGVGYFHFNPTTTLNGTVIDLQPIGTEGQGLPGYQEKYSRDIISVPLGGGVKVRLTRLVNFQMQLTNRIMFSDYVDDVSSRFYPNYLDLVEGNASALTQLLYSRAWEFNGDRGPDVISPNTRKASPDVKDYVFTGTVSFS